MRLQSRTRSFMNSRTQPIRWYSLLIVFAFALYVSAASGQAGKDGVTRSQHAMGIRMALKEIPNFGQVTPKLYRGGLPIGGGIQALKKLGVEIVVDLRGGNNTSEKAAVTEAGMQYVSIPSHCPFPRDAPFARFLKLIRENPGKKVFVHCRLGDDRTGMTVAAYRMAEEGWTADEALKEMRAFGFNYLHQGICPGMESYEQSFPQRLKKSPAFRDLPPHQDPAAK